MSKPTDYFWSCAGVGLLVFLICAGAGACGALWNL